ncbi:DUF4185 domain-containing protein [Nocardia alni]|uniref:DUF4185 domain-containing protein n=1 Tax=Nocardia alni TaxID=2815723 RepID=UPI001C249BB4|nr:DUF4185 domain-containing protein [Nocardia alni]
MKRLSALAGACAAVAVLAIGSSPAGADPNNINPFPGLNGTYGLPHLPGPTQAIFQLTGMASPNHTDQQNVLGTDLGIMWDDGRGHMISAYGDTAGFGAPNLLAGSIWAWRSNVLYRSPAGENPAHGIRYNSMVDNPLPSPKIPGIEISFIPTAGVSVGGVQFMRMMSVHDWGPDGKWNTNFSTLAASGDDGQTWAQLPTTRRASQGPWNRFQQSAYVKAGDYVYEYGSPPGRNNPAFIARVKQADIANNEAYEFWDGKTWKPKDVNAAQPIAGGIGELSVAWNDYLHQYVMLTTDPFNSVVMRTAPNPEGPWSPARVLVDARSLPTAYAPMIYPYQTGSSLYFALGVHNQYNVVLMRTPL